MLAQEIIRAKRDGHALNEAQIQNFVDGLTHNTWSEGQVAALGMAVFLRGMGRDEDQYGADDDRRRIEQPPVAFGSRVFVLQSFWHER